MLLEKCLSALLFQQQMSPAKKRKFQWENQQVFQTFCLMFQILQIETDQFCTCFLRLRASVPSDSAAAHSRAVSSDSHLHLLRMNTPHMSYGKQKKNIMFHVSSSIETKHLVSSILYGLKVALRVPSAPRTSTFAGLPSEEQHGVLVPQISQPKRS